MGRSLDETKYIGQEFGWLTGVSLRPIRLPSGKLTYKLLCACRCGSKKEIFLSSLWRTTSCGCDPSRYAKGTGANSKLFKGCGEIRAAFWNGYKEGARVRGIPFELTIEYAWKLYESQGRMCKVSGAPIGFGPNRKNSLTTASLDRIDSLRGYIEGNVQWVHKRVNLMRNVLGIEEFLAWCEKITQHNQKSSMQAA